ncbi:MAG: Do family serine endopeptidase [Pseudomonadota bacterium]
MKLNTILKRTVLGLLLTTSVVASGLVSANAAGDATSSGAGASWTQPAQLADLIEQVSPSVVLIKAKDGDATARSDHRAVPEEFFEGPMGNMMRRFFENDRSVPRHRGPKMGGIGSGFIIAPDGLIVTNHHVIDSVDQITVTLSSGEEISAELIGSDPKTDLAVLKIETEEPLVAAGWAASDDARVGDPVFAIGNPFGLNGSVTTGIISARGRNIGAGPYDDFIQTDASINKGNSGGPLFDQSGQVVGVNTAIFAPNMGGNVGVGFSIPAKLAQSIVEDIIEDGDVDRGWLGVSIQPVTSEIAASLGLEEARGLIVADVIAGSPAEAAGIKDGDIILRFEGNAIERTGDLTLMVAETEAGEEAVVTILRGGEEQDFKVEIAELVLEDEKFANLDAEPGQPNDGELGIALTTLDGAVVVQGVRPGSTASKAGLQKGDKILSVNRIAVGSVDDIVAEIDTAREDERTAILFQIERDGHARFMTLPLNDA